MAIEHTGRRKHKRTGRTSPHGAGERVDETSARAVSDEQRAGPPREEPSRYQDEGSDVPGLKKKIR